MPGLDSSPKFRTDLFSLHHNFLEVPATLPAVESVFPALGSPCNIALSHAHTANNFVHGAGEVRGGRSQANQVAGPGRYSAGERCRSMLVAIVGGVFWNPRLLSLDDIQIAAISKKLHPTDSNRPRF